MKPSRYYQSWLQVAARLSSVALYVSGFFLVKQDWISLSIFLIVNMIGGYFTSELRYLRSEAVAEERENGVVKNLRKPRVYQIAVQCTGRGKEILSFLSGVILGTGHPVFSIILLITQLVFGYSTTELLYLRDQSIFNNGKNGKKP